MSNAALGVIIGGVLPALLYGATNVFTKASTKAGIGIGYYLMIIGISITLVGVGFFFADHNRSLSSMSFLYAVGVGVTWGLGTGLIAVALSVYAVPLSKLVPLFNMNTLVAVILALVIFSEWTQVKMGSLIAGAALISVGGILVARS